MANQSGKKRTSSQTAKRRNAQQEAAREAFIIQEIEIIISFAIAVILFLCNFRVNNNSIVGAFGNIVSNIMFGIFGFLAYLAPILIFVAIAFGSINSGNPAAIRKIIAGVAIFVLLGIIIDYICYGFPIGDELKYEITGIYKNCSINRNGGGVISGSIAFFLCQFFDKVGSVLLILVMFIICLVILTERSFVEGVKKGSRKVVEKTFHDSDERREFSRLRKSEQEALRQNRMEERQKRLEERRLKEEEKENEKILRMDKKVTGITADTTLIKREELEINSKIRDDIHEITVEDTYIEEDVIDVKPAKKSQEKTFSSELMSNITIHSAKNAIDENSFVQQELSFDNTNTSVEKNISKPISKNKTTNAKYMFPSLNLLKKGSGKSGGDSDKVLKETALHLQQTLHTFGVNVTITDISQGPSVTRYELQPEQGVKVSKIVSLADDIKLNLAATDIRIEAPIPGKAAIGIEVPNKENSAVMLRDLLETKNFKDFDSNLAFAVGKDISGQTIVADIAKMPHMLIAGATGSGKSVCINTLIMSILYKAHPDDVKLIMIDPKVVELSVYNGIPHLLIPVVTDPKKAAGALHWGVSEMTDRYQKFADYNVRDLKGYNQKVEVLQKEGREDAPKKLPQIVIIVDELADLMMVAPGEVEESICRLAQLARACGIHLIIATQRPSVDVITGLIKANMPSRVAFAVSSGVDSRTILDMNGAEKLLGKGDMLFYPQSYTKPARMQGAFVSDKEVSDVVDFLKNQAIGNTYAEDVEAQIRSIDTSSSNASVSEGGSDRDDYFADAGRYIIEKDKASIGMLQRVFKIGFNRAARIMDQLCDYGVVGEEEGTKPRKVLMSLEQFEQLLEEI